MIYLINELRDFAKYAKLLREVGAAHRQLRDFTPPPLGGGEVRSGAGFRGLPQIQPRKA